MVEGLELGDIQDPLMLHFFFLEDLPDSHLLLWKALFVK